MDYITKLTNVYNNWGDKNNLQPLLSADEYFRGHSNLTESQYDWIDKFVKVWDKAEKIEYKKYKNNNLKKYEIVFSKRNETAIKKKIVEVKSLVSLIMEVDALKTKYQLENEHILEIKEVA